MARILLRYRISWFLVEKNAGEADDQAQKNCHKDSLLFRASRTIRCINVRIRGKNTNKKSKNSRKQVVNFCQLLYDVSWLALNRN